MLAALPARPVRFALLLASLAALAGGGLAGCTSDGLGKNGVAVSVAGRGTVSSTPAGISCPGSSCRHEFSAAELAAGVTLTALPSGGFRFNRWQFSGRLPTFLSDTDLAIVLRDSDAPPVGYTVMATFEPTSAADGGTVDGAYLPDSAVTVDARVADAEAADGGADAGPDAI